MINQRIEPATVASRTAAMSIPAFCDAYGIGRTLAYREVRAGRLRIRKVGRRSIVMVADAEEWASALPWRGIDTS